MSQKTKEKRERREGECARHIDGHTEGCRAERGSFFVKCSRPCPNFQARDRGVPLRALRCGLTGCEMRTKRLRIDGGRIRDKLLENWRKQRKIVIDWGKGDAGRKRGKGEEENK